MVYEGIVRLCHRVVLNEVWIQLIDGAVRAQRLQAPHSFQSRRSDAYIIDIINHSWRATFLYPGKLPIILHKCPLKNLRNPTFSCPYTLSYLRSSHLIFSRWYCCCTVRGTVSGPGFEVSIPLPVLFDSSTRLRSQPVAAD